MGPFFPVNQELTWALWGLGLFVVGTLALATATLAVLI
jgi:hypothetical protein